MRCERFSARAWMRWSSARSWWKSDTAILGKCSGRSPEEMRFSVVENDGIKSIVKRWILPQGRTPRRIQAGILRGLTMELDFQHQAQRWLGLQERELSTWLRRLARDIQTAIEDRKSTRLNSSHLVISYAVFCLKKKKYTANPYTASMIVAATAAAARRQEFI